MKHLFKTLLFSFVLFFNGSCADNLLSEFADENDDDAIIEQAKIYVSDGNYTKAIQMCSNLSSSGQTNANARYICASAYAGSCGLNTIDFLTVISGAAGQFLDYLIQQTGTTTTSQASDCDTAQNLLQAIGTAANRSDDQNMLMVFINIKKLQAYAEAYADADGDNVVDAGIDSCSSADYLDDTAVTNIASALWELKESAGSTGITDLENLGTAVNTYCTALSGFGAQYDFCTAADADTFTANQIMGVRSLIGESGGGFGVADCGSALGACCGL